MKYIIGVDGGNTKTDYFLFNTEGLFIDFLRAGTCSHEALSDSFLGSKREMKKVFDVLLGRNNLKPSDISFSVFGLAGCDIQSQKENLEKVISELGFINFIVCNDSVLGIKAYSETGACSICGTGTVASGVGLDGNYLQVGGIGEIVGDEAGGRYLARRAIRKTFDYLFRFGKKSKINDIVMDELGISSKFDFMEAYVAKSRTINYNRITKEVFDYANLNDEVCIDLLKEMADNLARSAGGVVMNLDLGDKPTIILAGSVYVKGASPILVQEFKKRINDFTKKDCCAIIMSVPPATGAIIWALEKSLGMYPNSDMRNKVIDQVKAKLEEIEG